ncbi:MAG: histidine phosphatase family protein [Chthoniobacteraceae bacterium]|nr:histidine phosphatase family protein [Chthoniobacteraceae bacterium]
MPDRRWRNGHVKKPPFTDFLSMLLYILRHADAEAPVTSDFERELTDKGVEQAKRAGRFCKEKGLRLDLILTSPLVRARETARHFHSIFASAPAPELAGFLASGMEPESAITELQTYTKLSAVMIVGHEPDLSSLISQLLGFHNPSILRVRKASLTSLEIHAWRPGGVELLFTLPCKLM